MAKYEVGDYCFDLMRFFPDAIFGAITEIRVNSPEIILRAEGLNVEGPIPPDTIFSKMQGGQSGEHGGCAPDGGTARIARE